MNKKIFFSLIVFLTWNLMANQFNTYVNGNIIRRCCSDAQAYNAWFGNSWPNAGPDRAWRQDNITPSNFTIYNRSESHPPSFADLSEQPQTSGFERSVYTSPR